MNIEHEIIELKKRIADLESLQSNELPFEVAPELLEKKCNWYDAIKYCKLLGNGWRLPSKYELSTIFTLDNDLSEDYRYWSSTECSNHAAWWYRKDNGSFTSDKGFCSYEYRVRPVRDKVKPKLPFVIAAKAFEIKTDWYSAVEHCNALGDGWRLPTYDELDLIYKTENDFNKGYYWSSTERPTSSMIVVTVSMKTGRRDFEDKWQSTILARAVRSK